MLTQHLHKIGVKKRTLRSWMLLVAVVTVMTACTSSAVMSVVYDRFGSSSSKQFKSYARYNEQQIQLIDNLADAYHSWHRRTQLPRYAEFLRSIVSDIKAQPSLSFETAEQWWITVRGYSDDMRACNPFNVSADLLASLDDNQVRQMANNLRTNLNKFEDEFLSEAVDERNKRRIKEMRKWGGRAGASFNDKQVNLLRETLAKQISFGKQRYELRRIWMEQYIVLLEQRKQPEFKAEVTRHIDATWNLTMNSLPEKWKKNERLWTEFIRDYINLQTEEQRDKFFRKALSTADVLDRLAVKEVKVAPVCHRVLE